MPRKSCPRLGFLTCTQGTSLLSALGPGGPDQGAHAWRPCSWARAPRGRTRRARAWRPVGRARTLRIRQHLLAPRPRRPAFLAYTSRRGSGARGCPFPVRCEQPCGTPCAAAASRSLSVPGTVASGGRAPGRVCAGVSAAPRTEGRARDEDDVSAARRTGGGGATTARDEDHPGKPLSRTTGRRGWILSSSSKRHGFLHPCAYSTVFAQLCVEVRPLRPGLSSSGAHPPTVRNTRF